MTINYTTIKTTLLASAALAFAGMGGQGALAATDTDSQTLSAVNQTTCTVSVPDVDFGTITDQAEHQESFQVTVTCPVDLGNLATLSANGGLNVTGAIPATQRRMLGDTPADFMDYEIYVGAVFTGAEPAIGDDSLTHGPSSVSTGAGSFDYVAVISSVITARIPGSYSDTVVWTLTF